MNIEHLNQINEYLFELPVGFKKGMRVPGRIYGSRKLIENMDTAVLEQLSNVAFLPGIVSHALCMPDGHSGYGFPIGGVAAMDPDEGVISPGGIGFDINCGVRLMRTSLTQDELKPKLRKLTEALFSRIPSGVGSGGLISLGDDRFNEAITRGAEWAVRNGHGIPDDLELIEEGGKMVYADPRTVSNKARARGKEQIGSLGSGNHYLEIQVVTKNNVFDAETARIFGIDRDEQIMVMIHSGSRGYGHQIATDYLKSFLSAMTRKFGLSMPDRELACAPFRSEEGQNYFRAMNCAINYAFLNRQVIMHAVKNVFSDIFKKSPDDLGLRLVYDVCHNTAKLEKHRIRGTERTVLVHRKGATRAFGPGMEGIPAHYKKTGQPVLIGGSMETGSYILAGVNSSGDAFHSTCHGSGRVMSRTQARSAYRGRDLQKDLQDRGILVLTSSYSGLAEEAGGAYKNVDEVIEATSGGGLSRAVARLLPLANIKG